MARSCWRLQPVRRCSAAAAAGGRPQRRRCAKRRWPPRPLPAPGPAPAGCAAPLWGARGHRSGLADALVRTSAAEPDDDAGVVKPCTGSAPLTGPAAALRGSSVTESTAMHRLVGERTQQRSDEGCVYHMRQARDHDIRNLRDRRQVFAEECSLRASSGPSLSGSLSERCLSGKPP